MGLGIATFGSQCIGTCYAHETPISMTGIVLGNAYTVVSNGMPTGQITNTVLADDGHVGIIISGSGTVNIEGLGAAYVTGNFVGDFTGMIISGSGNVATGL